MAMHHELPHDLLSGRKVLAMTTEAIVRNARSTTANETSELLKANMLEEKLKFLLQTVEQWLSGGGLGCSGPNDERLKWSGLWVQGQNKKVDWVTVGRRGGD